MKKVVEKLQEKGVRFMKLTSKEALKMLEDTRKDFENQGWIDHSICVGNAAGKIAEALNKNGMKLDIDKATTLGYIHDIGKKVGDFSGHAINGYNYLKELGVSNFETAFIRFFDMFLMDNKSFDDIFSKYDREDLIVKLEKNVAIMEHL